MNFIRQILYLTYFHMRSRYRKTWAGFLWVIASPILTFLIQSLVFKEIFKFQINEYPLFLLSGLLPWFFISQTFCSITSCLVLSREVLLSFKIDPLIIIASQVLDQFISFLAALIIMGFILSPSIEQLSIMRYLSVLINLGVLFYFVLIGTSLLSFWHVFYRDVSFVAQFIMGLAFYITPIFYNAQIFPDKYKWLLFFNPLRPFIEIFQHSIYLWNYGEWLSSILLTVVINLVLTFVTYLSFKIKMRDLYINV